MTSLSRAVNIDDLRRLARARAPRMIFDYIDGGAEDEITLKANIDAFRERTLTPAMLVDVSEIDPSTDIMGYRSPWPFLISPTAASRLFHRDGEYAVARAAADAGLIYSLSTMGSVAIEEVANIHPGPKWFQVYVWRDRELVKQGLRRAKAAGYDVLILTVDVPVAGKRERDPRNDFSIPPRVTARNALDALSRPAWLWDVVTSPKIAPANFEGIGEDHPRGIIGFIDSQFDRTVDGADAAWLIEEWDGPVAIKGIMRAEDAAEAVEIGAAAVWVSNHGGRQLDRAPATIDVLEPIVSAVDGRARVIFDGGVRRGVDIVTALALGADAVALGRAYLYGLAAGGEAGVRRALDILKDETQRTMALMGARRVPDISRHVVSP